MKEFFRRIAAVIVILLILFAAYYILDNYREKTEIEKLAAVVHLEDQRLLNDDLKLFLKDPSNEVRTRAAMAVGRIGGNEAGGLLLDMVKTDVIDVAAAAAFAIGLTGDKKYADDLVELAFDAPARVGVNAVDAAGRLADSSMTGVIDLLSSILTHPAPEVRVAVCLAIFRTNGKSQALALIDFIKNEDDEEVQTAALFALARLNIKEAFNIYVDFLSDADPFVRSLALRGIALTDNKTARQYLSIALNDGDYKVVSQAVLGLSENNNPDSRRSLMKKLAKTSDEMLTVDIINGLIRLEAEEAIETVTNLFNDSTPANIAAAAVKYLGTVQKDRAVMLIDSLTNNPNPIVRRACAEAFGVIGTNKNIPRLAVLFSDSDQLVRVNAFEQLMTIDSTNKTFYIDKALSDSGSILPSLAMGYINDDQLDGYLPQLRKFSDSIAFEADVRRSLLECAAGFIGKDSSNENALIILANSMNDEEYVIRKEAASIYLNIFGENKSDNVAPAKTRISVSKLEDAFEDFKENPTAMIETRHGLIEIELLFKTAPLTVINFIELARDDFYNGVIFHRVISNFVAQAGDPTGTGWGGPGYMTRCEYSEAKYLQGTVGIATSGKDTGGSQFFITHSPQPHLDGRYTIFGQVITGMDVVDRLVVGDTIISINVK